MTKSSLTYERILDDRPSPDKVIPPVALLYHGFGLFLDICRGRLDIQQLKEVKQKDLKLAVDIFAQKMSGYYCDEDERRDAALTAIHHIFSHRTGVQFPRPMAASISKGMEEHQNVFRGWRVPCLGLTIVGCDETFYAIIALDHQYRAAPLTSTLSCLPSANDGGDRKALYAAFTAASVVLAYILEDARTFRQSLPPDTLRRFPAITKLGKYGCKSNGDVEFQIQKLHPDRQNYRLLYIAKTKDGKELITKFGGNTGEVSYPTDVLNPELTEGRNATDLRITKDDDNRVLQITLDKLHRCNINIVTPFPKDSTSLITGGQYHLLQRTEEHPQGERGQLEEDKSGI
ncbi:hypothetical protein SERLADRAFT_417942 [Serpula lacrymans var. lacrymans S7.9]|uniref:Uncharacterized protein n=1 Tax=Serpula lacrymans var. lacrymans (strain S7.9) TaxID=578457 RepID=F8P927_SERL9|nr:uncharacterized protein SERLADRAFT_417942 [Serpula lacrymans var. lacrymans S7.9]EGO20156.1 hypothetical protein SERLADRAFT_417942 [Serpula lacrymans var. lacrymans S7.9]